MIRFIQDLSLNVHSYLDLFLHRSSPSFNNYWGHQQRYKELLGRKSASFIWCISKSTHEFEWYRVTCLYGLKKPWKWSKSFLVLFLKYGRKIPVKSRRISKVSLHFKKMANSSITVLQKYSEICIFCVTQCTGFQKQSVGGALKNFWKISENCLEWSSFYG